MTRQLFSLYKIAVAPMLSITLIQKERKKKDKLNSAQVEEMILGRREGENHV